MEHWYFRLLWGLFGDSLETLWGLFRDSLGSNFYFLVSVYFYVFVIILMYFYVFLSANAFVAVGGEATVQAARESERVLAAKLSAAALAPFPQRKARKAHKLEKLDFLLFPFRKVFVIVCNCI